jgi:DNA-binding transcriptional MerR regulator
MNIGEATRTAGASAKTVRYCKAAGLIATADRIGGRYRVYTHADFRQPLPSISYRPKG